MNQSLRQMLSEMGVPGGQIKSESFSRPTQAGASEGAVAAETSATACADDQRAEGQIAEASKTASVVFARSGKSVVVAASKTVLDVAEEEGVNIDYDCRAGICGTCKVKLLSGCVRLAAEDALTATDRANRLILSCQAHCIDEVTVEA
jgi:ferredoxin